MLARTSSVAFVGIDAHLVHAEIRTSQGVPSWTLIGLPARSVREAAQRVEAALNTIGVRVPTTRVLVNLAPAGIPKDGAHLDVAVAAGLLSSLRELPAHSCGGKVFVGELGLDGSIRPVRGLVAAALACRRANYEEVVCPAANAPEAASVEGIRVVPVATLEECIAYLRDEWDPPAVRTVPPALPAWSPDLRDVRGQGIAKQALEIAAAGGHNLLLKGPPGAGKTMLARRFPGILPALTREEAIEVTQIHSVAGLLAEGSGLVGARPFRSPHHHVSHAGLIGGGSGLARPGEAVLAHRGALFLDEMPLFSRHALESLRGPVEDGIVRIARSGGVVTYPCRFTLIGAMNPCPCGNAMDPARACSCSPHEEHTYRRRLSGPLLDRFDLQVAVLRPSREEFLGPPAGDRTTETRARVEEARNRQRSRYGFGGATNASISNRMLRAEIGLSTEAEQFLQDVYGTLGVSARGMDKVMRVARTVADLRVAGSVGKDDVMLALNFRLDPDREGAAA